MGDLDARAVFGLSPDEGHESDNTADGPETETEQGGEGYPSESENAADSTPPEPEAQPQTPKLFAGKYKTVQDLENAYSEAQKAISVKGQEAAEARRQLNEYNQYLQMLAQQQAYQQALQAQQAQMQQMQQAPPPVQEPTLDPEQFITEFYAAPDKALRKLSEPYIQRETEARMAQFYNAKLPELAQVVNQIVSQSVGPLVQRAQIEELRQQAKSNVQAMRERFSDFDELRGEVYAVLQEQPELATLQGGLELAYSKAKLARLATQAQTAQAAQQNQAITAQKAAAGMTGSAKVPPKTTDPVEQLKQSIFGSSKTGGVFG